MSTYMESVRAKSATQIADTLAKREKQNAKNMVEWSERLTPLEDRLAKLLSTIPIDIKNQGLSLTNIQNMLTGKWRGKCHPGELGLALRKLGYERRRSWSKSDDGFKAKWFPKCSLNSQSLVIHSKSLTL
jgi:hypothetical protein